MAEQKLTPEQKRERGRIVGMANLKSPLVDLAVSYLVNKNGQYGEAGDSAVEQYLYHPARYSEQGKKLTDDLLSASRQDGKRYTGNFSEYELIQNAAQIIMQSLGSVTVNDILSLMGSKISLGQNLYISNLVESENEKSQELVKTLLGSYQTYITNKKVSEALSKRADNIKGGLEKILTEKPEQKSEEELPLTA